MSRKLKYVELCPPGYMRTGRPNKEVLVSNGHVCNYCQGNGWFWGDDENTHERIKKDCPVCGGSGQLDAVVTVEWKAAKKEELP